MCIRDRSYIGIGVDQSMISFGMMINNARMELAREPMVWWSLVSAFVFMLALVLAAKVRAMLHERYHVGFDDIPQSVLPSLRHRLLLNFEGTAEGIRTDEVLGDIIKNTPTTTDLKV